MKQLKPYLIYVVYCLALISIIFLFVVLWQENNNALPPESTAPTETLEAILTTAPTEPDISWVNNKQDFLPYEAYFSEPYLYKSEKKAFGRNGNFHWRVPADKGYRWFDLEKDAAGYYIHQSGYKQVLRRLPVISEMTNCVWHFTDGKWLYGIRDNRQVIRVNLETEQAEVIFTGDWIPVDESSIWQGFCLYDDTVLYFPAIVDERIEIYRVYLPEMRLDVLYDKIPGSPYMGYHEYVIYDSMNIHWECLNPECVPYLQQILSDPDSKYRTADTEAAWSIKQLDSQKRMDALSTVIWAFEADYLIPAWAEYTMNCQTGEISVRTCYLNIYLRD